MKIPFVDLTSQYKSIKSEIDDAISEVIASNAFIGGKYVEEFEEKFASYIGVKFCVSCANGTDALEIVLSSNGIGPGDEVIVPSHSWISTSEAVNNIGADPVFVDTDYNKFTIEVNKIEEKINKRTKAIIPVHLYGMPADMDEIQVLATKHKLLVIEDAAQAHGAVYKNKKIGTIGSSAIFSFYPGKNLGAYGDGGCIVTNDEYMAMSCRVKANHGQTKKHKHITTGRNSRLDGMQAAILAVKLKYLDEWNEKRLKNAFFYNEKLNGLKQIETPVIPDDRTHIFHVYCIKANDRDKLCAFLQNKGIQTAIHYPQMLPFIDAYKELNAQPEDYPISYSYQDKLLSLPMYPELTEEMIDFVAKSIKEFYS